MRTVPPLLWPWSYAPFKPIMNPFEFRREGKGRESLVSKELVSHSCLSTFCESMGPWFGEGMSIVDIGCGSGRLANFLSMYLKDFTYVGTETGHARKMWKGTMDRLEDDRRVKFVEVGSAIEAAMISESDVCVAISVLTHLPLGTLRNWIYDKFNVMLSRNGLLIASMFLGEADLQEREKGPGYFSSVVYSSKSLFDSLANGLWMKRIGLWGDAGKIHHILTFRKTKFPCIPKSNSWGTARGSPSWENGFEILSKVGHEFHQQLV